MEQGKNIECLLRAGHRYPEDIYALLRKNEQQSDMCHVQGITGRIQSSMISRFPLPNLDVVHCHTLLS